MSRIKYIAPAGTPIFSEVFSIPASYIQGNNSYILPGTQQINAIGNIAMLPIATIFFNNTDGSIDSLQFGTNSNKLSDFFTLDGGRAINAVYYNINGTTAPYDVWFTLSDFYTVYWSGFNGGSGNLNGIFYYGKMPLALFGP